MNLDASIHDESLPSSSALSFLNRTEGKRGESFGVDSSVSSIEKSRKVVIEMFPLMNFPVLTIPSDQQYLAFPIPSMNASGRKTIDFVHHILLKQQEMKGRILKRWGENLREIEEQVRQLLRSPYYQQLQEIRRRGDTRSQAFSEAVDSQQQPGRGSSLISVLTRFQVLERVPPTIEIADSTPPQEKGRTFVLPVLSSFFIGGGIAESLSSEVAAQPLSRVVEFVEQLQPLFPQVGVQDFIPLINLMVMGSIYYHAWEEAVGRLKNREQKPHVQAVQNFAKDILRIVNDPVLIVTLIHQVMGKDHFLSSADQERFIHLLKGILLGVALSLLYAVEVGKVQKGKFGGMEPEEWKGLLLKQEGSDLQKPLSEHQKLSLRVLGRLQKELSFFSPIEKEEFLNRLFDYMGETRSVEPLLEPAKAFQEVLASTHYQPMEQASLLKI